MGDRLRAVCSGGSGMSENLEVHTVSSVRGSFAEGSASVDKFAADEGPDLFSDLHP